MSDNFSKNLVDKKVSIEVLKAKAVELEQASKYHVVPQSACEYDEIDNSPALRIDILGDGSEEPTVFKLSPFAMKQFLSLSTTPYGFFEKLPLHMKKYITSELGKNGRAISVLSTKYEDNQYIVGISDTRRTPFKNSVMIQELESFLASKNITDFSLEDAHLNLMSMGFRVVLKDMSVFIDEDDEYRYGIQVQNSEINYVNTLICPMLYRLVCENCLIDVKAQEAILKQRSISVINEAIQHCFRSTYKWIEENKESGIIKALRELKDHEITWNIKRIKAMLSSSITKGVSSDAANVFIKAVLDNYPQDDKFKVNAYDFVQVITDSAKQLPHTYRVKVETNMGSLLADSVAEENA